MKKLILILLTVPALFIATSCGENSKMKLEGDQSPYGEVGTRFSGTFEGGSNFNLTVTSLDNGVSTLEGTFTMTDPRYKKILQSLPKYCEVDGDKVTIHDIKFKATTDGIENRTGHHEDVFLKYDAKVGDTYSNGGKVTHVSKEKDNDFDWGGRKIRVIQVEKKKSGKIDGVKKITYWGNHRFGLVAVETEFDDGTTDFATISIF
jgi:hypothetical protein